MKLDKETNKIENYMENKDLDIELYLDFDNETRINKTSLLYALKHDPYSGEPDVNIGRAFKDGVYWGLKCKLKKKIEEKLSEKDYGFDSDDSEHGYESCLNDLLTWVNNIEWLND